MKICGQYGWPSLAPLNCGGNVNGAEFLLEYAGIDSSVLTVYPVAACHVGIGHLGCLIQQHMTDWLIGPYVKIDTMTLEVGWSTKVLSRLKVTGKAGRRLACLMNGGPDCS